jgi:rSAM/selenodomain-associated transferase 1
MQRRSENALVFMAKWPEPGRAKTRLTPPLTPDEAAMLARCFLLDTLIRAAMSSADRLVAFAPKGAASDFRALLGPDVGLLPAETPDFGVALRLAQATALALGYQRVALVASDLPHLPPSRYDEAFTALDRADVALGPCGDGGYYLLAAKRETPALFQGVAWSTEAVHVQTLCRAAAAALSVAALPSCDDIDTATELFRLADTLRSEPDARHTRAYLEQLPLLAPAPVR